MYNQLKTILLLLFVWGCSAPGGTSNDAGFESTDPAASSSTDGDSHLATGDIETKAETDADTDSSRNVEEDGDSETDSGSAADADADTEVMSDTDFDTDADLSSNTDSEIDTNKSTDTNHNDDTNKDTNSADDITTDKGSDFNADTGSADIVFDTNSFLDIETDSNTDVDINIDIDLDTNGLTEWDTLPPDTEKVDAPLYVDVRTPSEYDAGHCVDVINIPLDEIENRLDELGSLDRHLIVYCRSGNRSRQAKEILEANGFTDVEDGGAFSSLDCPKN